MITRSKGQAPGVKRLVQLLIAHRLERIAVLFEICGRLRAAHLRNGLFPCLEKSLSNAEITASLTLLREPRIRPAGLPRRHTVGVLGLHLLGD